MKKVLMTIVSMSIAGIGVTQAQTATDSWAVGMGIDCPRFHSVNINPLNENFGGDISIQRNFSEHVGLRLESGLYKISGQWENSSLGYTTESTNLFSTNLDLQYYLVPCERLSPYFFGGLGGIYKKTNNTQTAIPDKDKFGAELNVGTGAEYKINSDWRLTAEFAYHLTNNSSLDGTIVPTEMNGRDSYLVLGIGAKFLFGKGKPSTKCDECQQVTCPDMKDMTDYKRIEDMIIANTPKSVAKEAVDDKCIVVLPDDKLVLIGVRFAFDKSDLLMESYPILDKAIVLINGRPDVSHIEIQGYTDSVGTDDYNNTLSMKRAQTVQSYLVSKGISQDKLTTVGYGKLDPIEGNSTDEGRAMNRRIVFKMVK